MTPGQSVTIYAVRIATILYTASVAAWLVRRDRVARATWTAACGFYLVHVAGAFQYYHHWSHIAAYQETARQTGELFGIDWGGGLYFNYFLTLLWIADVLWWWRGLRAYRERCMWIAASVQWFFVFMFFNATVVFASGLARWFGIAATLALLALSTLRSRRPA
jgi:hypothetical protein